MTGAAAPVPCVSADLAASLWPAVAPGADLPGAARGTSAPQSTPFDAVPTAGVPLACPLHAARPLRAAPAPEDGSPASAPTREDRRPSHAGRRPAASGDDASHLS